MLAEMYRPPFEIMYRPSWDNARQEGKDNEKWILVNIQDPSIFDCQVLNRDIWKNQGIKDTIKENFLFMQYTKDDPRGQQYRQYYFQNCDNPNAYPHIAIVDPRTGEQVKVWSGPPVPKPADFLMQLHEFLDRYSLNITAKNPVAKRKPEAKKEKNPEAMTEEEQLEWAMQNSLANGPGPKDDDPDDLTRSFADVGKGKGAAVDEDMQNVEQEGVEEEKESAFAQISSNSPHTEPAAGPQTARMQFRISGSRIIHSFLLSDPVRRIYEWLKASPPEGKGGKEFELVFMGKGNLIEHLDETVEQAGLKGAAIMVEYPED